MGLFFRSFFNKGTAALKKAFKSKYHFDSVTLEHSYMMGGVFAYLIRICMLDDIAMFYQIDKELYISSMSFNDLAMVGALHDLGKQFIKQEILHKPGKLTNNERELIKNHPNDGSHIIHNLTQHYGDIDKKLVFADLISTYHHNARLVRNTKFSPIIEIAQIADIIDATMQKSRTYHLDGVSIERTLSILQDDAKSKKIDRMMLNMVLDHLDSIIKILALRPLALRSPKQYLKAVSNLTQQEVSRHPMTQLIKGQALPKSNKNIYLMTGRSATHKAP